jgi:hypothetical protein
MQVVEQKSNKNVSWSSKKLQVGRAKKCKTSNRSETKNVRCTPVSEVVARIIHERIEPVCRSSKTKTNKRTKNRNDQDATQGRRRLVPRTAVTF